MVDRRDGEGGRDRRRSRSWDRDQGRNGNGDKRGRFSDDKGKNSSGAGAGEGVGVAGGDVVARLAASISKRVVQQETERLNAIEKELITKNGDGMDGVKDGARNGAEDDQEEVRRARQEKLKVWREQQERMKRNEKTTGSGGSAVTMMGLASRMKRGKPKARAPSIAEGWGASEEDGIEGTVGVSLTSSLAGQSNQAEAILAGDADADPLDAFMSTLSATSDVVEQQGGVAKEAVALAAKHKFEVHDLSSKSITLEELLQQSSNEPRDPSRDDKVQEESPEEREKREDNEKKEFLEALRRRNATGGVAVGAASEEDSRSRGANFKEESEKLGRLWEGDGDMIEEHEGRVKQKDALTLLAESVKKKELKQVDHSKIEYIAIRKNMYIVPKALASLSAREVQETRGILEIKIRGKGAPPPVERWDQCGLSDRILAVIERHKWEEPFPIQKQAIPAIMCGRDVIGVAQTGSGKTLAFLLPMFRHILDQPPLKDREGPIGLIMAPARELAVQIYVEAKRFSKALGIRVAAVYGGAGIADQIAGLKRGAEIVVCTPGRMIDILTMQAGRLLSLTRVSFVVMDEADRMFDMGFEPQIKMILQNVRPDRQTVLFSATFPQKVEQLARKVLQYPLEIIAGGRSVASETIAQFVEVRDEDEKYLRLLQLLGIWYERGNVLIFVDTQARTDKLFGDLTRSGYPALSLHGGRDQADRDVTISDFKQKVRTLMVATSVAGRGLDVPELVCVINYSCPNHLEDYVHRVGRTGRAGRKGTAYTFISQEEEMHAPMLVKALAQSKQSVPLELKAMADNFIKKVEAGEARYASSGFSGRGFTFDDNEKSEEQKLRDEERHQYEVEQGLRAEKSTQEDIEAERLMAAEDEENEATLIAGPSEGALPSTSSAAAETLCASSCAPEVPVAYDPIAAALEKKALEAAAAREVAAAASTALLTKMTPSALPVDPIAAAAEAAALSKAQASLPESGTISAARAAALAVANRISGNLEPTELPAAAKVNLPTTTPAGGAPAAPAAVVVSTNANGLTVRTAPDGQQHFEYSLVINEYPQLARWKVTQKETISQIIERTTVAVTARGAYCPPGKSLPEGEEKLNLRIESPSEIAVENAIAEFQRLLNEETLRIASHPASQQGRYKVV